MLSDPLLDVHVTQCYTVGASSLLHGEPAGSRWLKALHKAVSEALVLTSTEMLPAMQGWRTQQTYHLRKLSYVRYRSSSAKRHQ